MWGSFTKILSKALEYAPQIASTVGAVAPLFAQQSQPKIPDVKRGKTKDELEAEQAKAATEKRREIARRKGAGSTFRTTRLGVTNDVTTRRPKLGVY